METRDAIVKAPAWRYKYGQRPKIIETEAELEAAAAEGWVDHPVDFAPDRKTVSDPGGPGGPPWTPRIDTVSDSVPEAAEAPRRKRKRKHPLPE